MILSKLSHLSHIGTNGTDGTLSKKHNNMKNYKYSLAKKGKSTCPMCKQKTFVLYLDTKTGKPLHSTVGKCDRANNCAYHYSPKQYFSDNNISSDNSKTKNDTPRPKLIPEPKPSFIKRKDIEKSLSHYGQNNFVQWIAGIAGAKPVSEAVGRYFVGTSIYWVGSTVFLQIDRNGHIHTGKIMLFDEKTGKRIKEPENKIQWVHKVLNLPDFNLVQCFFGEHLLGDKSKPVAIVESEKTAFIASMYFPKYIWLACGGSEGLNMDKFQCLKGCNVVLYPDAGKFDKWNKKAKELSALYTVSVSSLIEQIATEEELKNDYDLADYIVMLLQSEYNKQPSMPQLEVDTDEKSTINTEENTFHSNPIVVSTVSANQASSSFAGTIDCETVNTETTNLQSDRNLTDNELKNLIAEFPDIYSLTKEEVCEMLNIVPQDVDRLVENGELDVTQIRDDFYSRLDYVPLKYKYSKRDSSPF